MGNTSEERKIVALPDIDRCDGKDELNFAEFPLGVLRSRGSRNVVTRKDQIWDQKIGRKIERELTIRGCPELGLPTGYDEDILVGLVQLTRAQNQFTKPEVVFLRSQLIDLLGLPDNGKTYKRIRQSLQRWLGVTLIYNRAWREHKSGRWLKLKDGFHILEHLQVLDAEDRREAQEMEEGPEFMLSRFTWNRVVFDSFQAGYVKRLDLGQYLTLNTAIAKRMYRFLDKRFFHAAHQSFELTSFAIDKVGLTPSYRRKVGKIKEKLASGIRELETMGFIEKRDAKSNNPDTGRYTKDPVTGEHRIHFDQGSAQIRPAPTLVPKERSKGAVPTSTIDTLRAKLVDRGIGKRHAESFLREKPATLVQYAIEQHDNKKASGEMRTNPSGYLFTVLENCSLPGDFVSKAEKERRSAAKERDSARIEQAAAAKEAACETRLDAYLDSLSGDSRLELETAAFASATSFEQKHLQEIGAIGESVRRNLLKRHVGSLLNAKTG